MINNLVKAQEWFNSGTRMPFDYHHKKIVSKDDKSDTSDIVYVFQRLVKANNSKDEKYITMMPGFPDGSYGWSMTERELSVSNRHPRLYVEYVGQGDSDKPNDYPYSTMERADLIEALWKYYSIEETILVTFDISSLVAMELLRRQQESNRKTKVTRVLLINGGLFADAHSHPIMTTPFLKTKIGKLMTKWAQRSQSVFNIMAKDLWSKEYKVSEEELREVYDAITRRKGATFMSNAAGVVDEHKRNADRWDLLNIYKEMNNEVSFHIVGSKKDQFEPNQVVKARERLGKYNVDIRLVPGGHMTTSEHPDLLANLINEVCEEK